MLIPKTVYRGQKLITLVNKNTAAKTINTVAKIPSTFILRGAGRGHGVGMCQIGAAVVSKKG